MRIYRIETEYGTLYARRVDAQSYQHPSEVARGFAYEQCTPEGFVLNGVKMITGSTEEDVIKAGGVLIPSCASCGKPIHDQNYEETHRGTCHAACARGDRFVTSAGNAV